jgi:ABC-type multidrug transport system ATPase subunit
MIGFLESTSGQAFIDGKDLSTDMNSIYQVMGVCPQDNLLWETLTAREHLNFYARLKGLNGVRMREAVDAVLQSLHLLDAGNKRVGKFSGGAFSPPALCCIVLWSHLSTQCATSRPCFGSLRLPALNT